jgi:myo-inositol-1(or 4)-monophosphatase
MIMSVDPRVAACYQIAKEACDLARVMPPTIMVEKSNGDLATLADIAAHTFIIEEIIKRFPDDTIKSEEGSPTPGTSDVVWHVDPLDGTLNFLRHMGPWAVSIGVLRGNTIVAGCIVEGSTGDIFTASQGAGAQRNGRPIHVSATAALNEALVGFDCPYDQGPRMQTTYPAIGKLLEKSKALRCYGSCAIALCKIATGELDSYAVEYGKSWDFAAGTLLVREAGGTVTTWAGENYHPEHNTQVLATNGILHENIRGLLTPYVAAHPTS